jgi:NitT/TauT family transport system substrate-binding protein
MSSTSNKSLYAFYAVIILATISTIFYFTTNSKVENKLVDSKNEISTTPIKVKIGYLPVTQSLPLFIAQEQNLFGQNNLEVELVKFEQPTQMMESFLTGQIDVVGFTGATGILSIANSKNPEAFKILNTGYSSSQNPVDVLVTKDVNIKSISELKGKTCGILAGPQFKAMFTKVAQDSGLKAAAKGTAADINYQEMPVSEFAPNLASGNIECVLGLEPFGSLAESKSIGKIAVKSPIAQSLGGRFYGVASAVNSQFITKNGSAVKKLTLTMDQAIDKANSPTLEQRQMLMTKLGLPLPLAPNLPLQNFIKNNSITNEDFAGIKALTDTMVSTGNQTSPSNLEKAIWKE